jgi:hypothetical protein
MPVRDPSSQLEVFGPIFEDSSAVYKATVVDENGDPIIGLSSIKASLFDRDTGTIINSRKSQSVLEVNGGHFDIDTSIFTLHLTPDDNYILNQSKEEEDHILRFDYTYNSGQSRAHHAILIRVRNLQKLG